MKITHVICSISIPLLLLISGCISSKLPDNRDKGITALEQYDHILSISKSWKNDSILKSVNSGGSGFYHGHSNYWLYSFSSLLTNRTNSTITVFETLNIYYYSNGSYMLENNTSTDNSTINNWNIDSDQAYRIMTNNSKIKKYIKTPGVHSKGFLLTSPARFDELKLIYQYGIEKENAVWYAQWGHSSEIAGPVSAEIWIDAYNGTVILV